MPIDIIHRHFFFSPNNSFFSPKIAPDLGEIAIRLGEGSYMQIAKIKMIVMGR